MVWLNKALSKAEGDKEHLREEDDTSKDNHTDLTVAVISMVDVENSKDYGNDAQWQDDGYWQNSRGHRSAAGNTIRALLTMLAMRKCHTPSESLRSTADVDGAEQNGDR